MVKKATQMQEQETISNYPSVHWEKFFNKFPEIETLNIKEWTNNHIIGYFCKRYKDYYSVDYTFKFNSTSPSKSYEIYNLRKLSSMLSANPIILKDYIDYFFVERIIDKKKRITSMAYLTDANVVNDYKFKKLAMNKNINIERSMEIPPNYLEVIQSFGIIIKTYGELSFIKMRVDSGIAEDKYKDMLAALSKSGLDVASLNKVK